MRTGRPKQPFTLTEEDRERLESLAHRARSQALLARRARVVLGCAEGLDNQAVARKLRCSVGMGGQVARTVSERWSGGAVRRAAAGSAAHRQRCPGRAGRDANLGDHAARRNPLVDAWIGGGHYNTMMRDHRDGSLYGGAGRLIADRGARGDFQPHPADGFEYFHSLFQGIRLLDERVGVEIVGSTHLRLLDRIR
jgi:hypothetical protein